MNLQELVSHIARWGEGQENSSAEAADRPEEQYAVILEREMLKKGKVLLKRYQDFQERIRGLEAEKEVLKSQILDFERETSQMVDLPTGDQVKVDLSNRPRVREFWDEARRILGSTSSLPSIDLKDLLKNSETPEKLYDPAFLAQESDDLLRYL